VGRAAPWMPATHSHCSLISNSLRSAVMPLAPAPLPRSPCKPIEAAVGDPSRHGGGRPLRARARAAPWAHPRAALAVLGLFPTEAAMLVFAAALCVVEVVVEPVHAVDLVPAEVYFALARIVFVAGADGGQGVCFGSVCECLRVFAGNV